jgi:ABC-type branched-subunit amino acid transport system substrate-binding protein
VSTKRFSVLSILMSAGLAGTLAMSGTAGAAAADSSEGVTPTSVKIGFITSKTGLAASTFGSSDAGCKGRIGRENANGGVNGRKIEVVYADDQSSGQNLTVAQDLAQNKHVFMVVDTSPFTFLSYRWLLDNGVPTIGSGIDGTEYGEPGNEKLISGLGNSAPSPGITYEASPKIMKALGVTKVASLGYSISPSSTAAAKSFAQNAAPALGLKSVYLNTTIDFGTTDVSPLVLGIKASGADGAFYAMDAETNLAISQGLVQNGVKMKAEILGAGYGQALLDEPVAAAITPDVIFSQAWAPVEANTKATKQLQADLKKYGDYTGVPDAGVYNGYVDCDLAILGLRQQGKTLDQATYSDDLRKLGHFNPGDGLGCQDNDITAEHYGQAPATGCTWASQLKNGKFVLFKPKDGKTLYWTGKLIPSSESAAASTTTNAP